MSSQQSFCFPSSNTTNKQQQLFFNFKKNFSARNKGLSCPEMIDNQQITWMFPEKLIFIAVDYQSLS